MALPAKNITPGATLKANGRLVYTVLEILDGHPNEVRARVKFDQDGGDAIRNWDVNSLTPLEASPDLTCPGLIEPNVIGGTDEDETD